MDAVNSLECARSRSWIGYQGSIYTPNLQNDNISVLLNQRPTPNDVDGDDDVQIDDFALFPGCMSGPDNRLYP